MKIYVVRHGLTEYNKQHLINGQLDDGLAPEGIEQARKAVSQIPKGITHIYSSPLMRAKQTAEILNSALNITISYHDELKEIDFGLLTGTDFSDEIDKKHCSLRYDWRPYNGECAEDVKKRVLKILKDIKAASKDGEALIVSHGGIIRMISFLQDGVLMGEIGNASVHSFDLDRIVRKIKLLSWNIWGGKYLDGIISFLKQADADIIALQEVIEDDDGGNTALAISKALGYECAFNVDMVIPSKWTGPVRDPEKMIRFGNAILSKNKIVSSASVQLSENRTAIQADIQVGEMVFHTYSIHLKHQHVENPDPKSEMLQKEQVDTLINLLPSEKAVIMGDFNSKQGTYPLNEMDKAFLDTENGDSTPTWTLYKEGCDKCPLGLLNKFDYIFTSKEIEAVSFSVGDSKASDHLPVMADIEIRA